MNEWTRTTPLLCAAQTKDVRCQGIFAHRKQTMFNHGRADDFPVNRFQCAYCAERGTAIDNQRHRELEQRRAEENHRQAMDFKHAIDDRRRQIRDMLQSPSISTQAIQTAWSDKVIWVLIDFYLRAFGPTLPKDFAIVLTGSIARREACPYSDIEGFTLVRYGSQVERFREYGRFVAQAIRNSEVFANGFELDDGESPAEMINTPENIVAMHSEGDSAKLDTLVNYKFILGDYELFGDYSRRAQEVRSQVQRGNRSGVIRLWRDWIEVQGNFAKLPTQKDTHIDIKESYYRWLTKIPSMLGQYYGVNVTGNTRAIVSKLREDKHISDDVATTIIHGLDVVGRLRVKAQMHVGAHGGDHMLSKPEQGPKSQVHLPRKEPEENKPREQSVAKYVISSEEKRALDQLAPQVVKLAGIVFDFISWSQDAEAVDAAPKKKRSILDLFRRKSNDRSVSPFLKKVKNYQPKQVGWTHAMYDLYTRALE